MSVTVRPLGDKDFFAWLGLFEGYSTFYESELTDQKALQVWSWIIDTNDALSGAVAVNDDGDFVGFAHYRTVPRTLSGDLALFLDDLYVAQTGPVVDKAVSDKWEIRDPLQAQNERRSETTPSRTRSSGYAATDRWHMLRSAVSVPTQ